MEAKNAGRPEVALDVCFFVFFFVDLTNFYGLGYGVHRFDSVIRDIARLQDGQKSFKDLHEALQKNLQTYLPLYDGCSFWCYIRE